MKMKVLKSLTSIIFLGILFTSCQKTIDIDLNKTNPLAVFNVEINNQDTPNIVNVSYTRSYYDNTTKGGISGVKIKITKLSDGSSEMGTDLNNGNYKFYNLKRECDRTYSMEAILPDGKTYKAQSYMPCVKDIDSLNYKYEDAFAVFKKGYYVYFYGKDPVDERNFYKFDIYQNDTLVTKNALSWLIGDDKFLGNDGNLNGLRAPFDFRKYDTVECILSGLNQDHFNYLRELQNQLNSDGGLIFSPPPANPRTNIDNGGIGYFSTVGIRKRKIVITK